MPEAMEGRSIRELIQERLDKAVVRVQSPTTRTDRERGRAEGLAEALSIILNPYNPDISVVRDEAMQRYSESRSKRRSRKSATDSTSKSRKAH